MENEQNKSAKKFAVILLVIAAVLLIFGQWFQEDIPVFSRPKKTSKQTEGIINKHLMQTSNKIELDQLRAKIQNDYTIPRVGTLVPKAKDQIENTIKIDSEQEVANTKSFGQVNPTSPRGVVENEMAEEQEQQEADQRYREAYVKEFIANARRGGWKVEVDKNGVVTRVEPIHPGSKNNNIDEISEAPR